LHSRHSQGDTNEYNIINNNDDDDDDDDNNNNNNNRSTTALKQQQSVLPLMIVFNDIDCENDRFCGFAEHS